MTDRKLDGSRDLEYLLPDNLLIFLELSYIAEIDYAICKGYSLTIWMRYYKSHLNQQFYKFFKIKTWKSLLKHWKAKYYKSRLSLLQQ